MCIRDSGVVPGGLARNRMHCLSGAVFGIADADPALIDLACDPQTSGGLLCAVPANTLAAYCAAMDAAGEQTAIIGEIMATPGICFA